MRSSETRGGLPQAEANARKDRCEKEDTLVTQNLPPDSGSVEGFLFYSPKKGQGGGSTHVTSERYNFVSHNLRLVEYT